MKICLLQEVPQAQAEPPRRLRGEDRARKDKDKEKKIKDKYTNFYNTETRSCNLQVYQLIGWCDKQEECQLIHDKKVPWEIIGCALPRADARVLTRLGFPADAIVCKAGGQGQCMYDHTTWTADSNAEMVEAIKADPSIMN